MESKLFQPIKIKSMELKNRLGMAPFLNNPIGEGGTVTDLTIRWFAERAKGGIGFIMTGAANPSLVEDELRKQMLAGVEIGLSIYDDRFIPGFARLADAMHALGTKIGVQIAYGAALLGRGMSPGPYPDATQAKDWRPEISFGVHMPVKELSAEQLVQVEDDMAAAAARIKAAGMDCVELHCAHGGATIGCASISPFYNRRTDQYGGSWENRLRLPTNMLKKMRRAVGDDYPIFVRIDGDELLGERGITLDDTVRYVVPALEAAGADCLDVSQGSILHSPEGINLPGYLPRGCFIHHAAAVKAATKLPVIGVGAIFDLNMAERFLAAGKADIIYLGRLITADPEAPNKYREGRADEIRKCIGCIPDTLCGSPCTVNYEIQTDYIPLTPAAKPKKVLVVGGGVAGMEAARVAALRGHRVTLVEKEGQLGGVVGTLALNPLLGEFGNVVAYLASQMAKRGVDVRVCKEVTAAEVTALKPDVVILAAGSVPTIPSVAKDVPGVITLECALQEKRLLGQKVIVWGFFGAELAVSLAEEGRDVVLIGRGGPGSLASDLPWSRRWWLLRKLTDINVPRASAGAQRLSNVRVMYNAEIEEVTPVEIRVADADGGKETLAYDTLVLARRFGERKANDDLFGQVGSLVPEVFKIGDCAKVQGIQEAIRAANEVARTI